MKDIVDKLQDSLEYEFNLSFSERKQLLERVKSLEEVKETLDNMVRERQIKIDKAIEYIHNHQLVFELSTKKQIQKWFDEFYRDILDILRGVDND